MANNFENPEVFMEVAKAAAGHYADSYAVKLLAFSENATYLVYDPATDEKLFVLRAGRPGYHTREEYESEISWLRQINDYTPLKVANPIPASDGSYIQEIEKDKVTYFCIATEIPAFTPFGQLSSYHGRCWKGIRRESGVPQR
jgi:Ser/Thr protein kinase RdoA (MazF antagonist)